jgi:hypothetical protein
MTLSRRSLPFVSLLLAACGADPGDGPDARPPADAAEVDRCEALLEVDSPDERAGLNLFDLYRGQDVLIIHRIDDCRLGSRPLTRGGMVGQGFLAGTRTLTIETGGETLPPIEMDAAAHDQLFYALDVTPDRILGGARVSDIPPVDGWAFAMMNMAGSPIRISRVVDPTATPRQYEVLAESVAHGEAMPEVILPATAASGAWVRIERDGATIFEDNPLFFRACAPWPLGDTRVFGFFDDSELGFVAGVMYGVLEHGCPEPGVAPETRNARHGHAGGRWSRDRDGRVRAW